MPAEELELVHRGYLHDRTTVDDAQGRLEKTAAEYWEKGMYFGQQIVPYPVLLRARITGNPFGFLDASQRVEMPSKPLDQEEATMAATVFQWIFTPIGRSALYEVCTQAGWTITMSPRKEDEKKPQEQQKPVITIPG